MIDSLAVVLGVSLVVIFAFWLRAEAGRGGAVRREAAAQALAVELRRELDASQTEVRSALEARTRAEVDKAKAEVQWAEAQQAVSEQRALLDSVSSQMVDTFKALSADALKENRAELLAAAEQGLKALSDKTVSDLDSRKSAIELMIRPLKDAMDEYQKQNAALEERRIQEIALVQGQYRDLASSAAGLQQEAAKLVNALRSPHVRGRWGQLTLRRTAELTGMVAHCDFYEQETASLEDGRIRPDMLVRLPAQRLIVVDSKVPLDAYLRAVEATSDTERQDSLLLHGKQMRDHVSRLGSKDYQSGFDTSPEFVVQFVPSDSIVAAAVERDPDLIEYALTKGVVIATPSTLFALLRAVAHGWRQDGLAENARQIAELGQQLSERIRVLAEHFERVGGAIRKAVDSYNEAVGSFESRVLPAARRFRALGRGGIRPIPDLDQIDVVPRSVLVPSVTEGAQEIFPDDDALVEDGPGDDDEEEVPRTVDAPPGPYTCTCKVCGIQFEGSGPNARYCSEACRDGGRDTSLVFGFGDDAREPPAGA